MWFLAGEWGVCNRHQKIKRRERKERKLEEESRIYQINAKEKKAMST